MYVDLIRHWARETPDALAFSFGEHGYTYGKLADDVHRCANRLARLGLPRGTRAASKIANPYLHWVAFLACLELGYSATGIPSTPPPPRELYELLRPDLLISDTAPPYAAPFAVVHVDQAWADSLRDESTRPRQPTARRPDDPLLIILSSGTTGRPKKVLVTRDLFERRIAQAVAAQAAVSDISRSPKKCLAELGIVSLAGQGVALRAWSTGGSYRLRTGNLSWHEAVCQFEPDLMYLTPYQLRDMLRSAPQDYSARPHLWLRIWGGSLSRPLALEALERITPNIIVAYGSTEAANVSQARLSRLEGLEDTVGHPDPNVLVQIVDASGLPLSPGETGEVRVRGPSVVGGYFEDDDLTDSNFRDGWFYPGDSGRLSSQGVLTILGRSDDLLVNCRIPAPVIEEMALAGSGIEDAAVFEGLDDDALPVSWVAYIAASGLDVAKLAVDLSVWLRKPVRLVRVDHIPRNSLGKVQRSVLRSSVVAGVGQGALSFVEARPQFISSL